MKVGGYIFYDVPIDKSFFYFSSSINPSLLQQWCKLILLYFSSGASCWNKYRLQIPDHRSCYFGLRAETLLWNPEHSDSFEDFICMEFGPNF